MAVYTVSRSNTALNTSNDWVTILGGSARRFRILEVSFSGMGATSAAAAALEVGVSLSTGGTTPGGALTPKKWDTNTAAFSGTTATTWAAQPTLSGDPYARLAFQAYGGIYRWTVHNAPRELVFHGTEQCSIRSVVGTANVTGHVVIEEI